MSETDSPYWLQQKMPADYFSTAIALGKEWGLTESELLSALNLDIQSGIEFEKISPTEFMAVIAFLDSLEKSPFTAMEIGWRMPPSAYGAVGFALLCCRDLRACLRLMYRFWPLVTPNVSWFSFAEDNETCTIHLELHPSLAGQSRRYWLQSALVCWKRSVTMLLGKSEVETEIWFDFASPGNAILPPDKFGKIRFDMPINQVIFPREIMDMPLPMYNEAALSASIERCEQELLLCSQSPHKLLTQVQQLLVLGNWVDKEAGKKGYPTLQKLADDLSMSERTLRRRLKQSGSSFQQMLESSQRRDAVRLLGNSALNVQDVAELLGYADPANFIRRFRQWTGVTPNQYRQCQATN